MPLFKNKKKFAETTVGKFLKEKAPHILDKAVEAAGKRFPTLGLITDLIKGDDKLSEEDKKTALEMAAIDLKFEEQITNRWISDNKDGSWMARNARPLVLLSSVLMLFVFIILDSLNIKFEIETEWVDLYKVMLETVIGGYFLMRTADKFISRKKG